MADVPSSEHYADVARAIMDGRLTPVLGAGVNLCAVAEPATPGVQSRLPSGVELAAILKRELAPDPKGEAPSALSELTRVSQEAVIRVGAAPLYSKLREIFDRDYPPTVAHDFLARVPKLTGPAARSRQLIVTTNYDDALERAFIAAGEAYDVVSYQAVGECRGKFVHWPPGGEATVIEPGRAREYIRVSPDDRTVVLKIHGLIDRMTPTHKWDSFVITEDDYITYLARSEISELIPIKLVERLKNSSLLFLGYSLKDWNLRVILHRIWESQWLDYKSWSVQLHPDPLDVNYWRRHQVEIFDMSLDEYTKRVESAMRHLKEVEADSSS